MSYIAGLTETAVVRSATSEDRVAIARLVARESAAGPDADPRPRQDKVSDTLASLRDRRAVVHVVELRQRLCGAVILQIAGRRRIFASRAIVSEAGRAFDPALALRMMEHAVQCCQADGWRELRYLADLDDPSGACGDLRRLHPDCTVREARIGLGDRLRFGRRSHELRFAFPERAKGSDNADPRIVWF